MKTAKLVVEKDQPQLYQAATSDLAGLGGYAKRESQQFFEQMSPESKQRLWQQLKSAYRQIIINYFASDQIIKNQIEQFTFIAFCTNITVPQMIEIHMEVIDELAKQLKLEGRNDDILLDYRLTLIELLAHLCERYRSAFLLV